MQEKRYYHQTGKAYTLDEFIEQGIYGLPNVDHLKDIWERLPVVSQYDSTVDTLLHIKRVNELLLGFAQELLHRAATHDRSKLGEQEKPYFDKLTPLLAGSDFGSDEYKGFLKQLGPALEHHYANNSHHPEHYENGIDGMDLLDVLEMFADWKAASERHKNGDIYKSIEINKKRFKMSAQLEQIFINTASRMGFKK